MREGQLFGLSEKERQICPKKKGISLVCKVWFAFHTRRDRLSPARARAMGVATGAGPGANNARAPKERPRFDASGSARSSDERHAAARARSDCQQRAARDAAARQQSLAQGKAQRVARARGGGAGARLGELCAEDRAKVRKP